MEPDGWERLGLDGQPATLRRPAGGEPWSDLLLYDPTGVVGDVTRRSDIRHGKLGTMAGRDANHLVAATEARLRAEGFERPGPRRRAEDLETGARYLFQRAVLRMRFSAIADEEPATNDRVDEVVVRMTASRWARELQIPLPPRGRPRA